MLNDCFPGTNIFSMEAIAGLPTFAHARGQVPPNQWDRGLKNKIARACDQSDLQGLAGTKLPPFEKPL
jgi:hypothetical protein